MKYTTERLPESRVAIDVEVEPEVVEQALNRAARRIAQRARIPGFRPGKAPRYIVEMHFGRGYLYEEAAEELVQQALKEILERDDIKPVGQASVERLELEPLSFRLVIPVQPTVTLGDYRSLRFAEEVRPVSDEDVEQALRRMQEEQTVWREPDPMRPARAGDRLVVDVRGRAGERVIEEREGLELTVGAESLLPGFEALAGAELGQTLEIATTLPADLEDESLAGQPAVYTVTVRGIKEPDVPPLDDDFARHYGQGEQTLAELRARLREDLEEQARREARGAVVTKMLDAIVEGATVDMPQVLVDREVDTLLEERAQQLRAYNISLEQFFRHIGRSEGEYRQELAETVPDQLRRYLVLGALLRAEGIAEGPGMFPQLEERLVAIARGELQPAAAEEPVAEGAEPAAEEPVAEGAEPAAGEPVAVEAMPTAEGPAPAEDAGVAAAEPSPQG